MTETTPATAEPAEASELAGLLSRVVWRGDIALALGLVCILVVLILPTSYHVDETVWSAELDRLGLDPSAFQIGLAQERLVAICSRLGLPHVDFTELARELDDPQSIFLPENLHLNPHGHRLVARRLTETIEGLLPR